MIYMHELHEMANVYGKCIGRYTSPMDQSWEMMYFCDDGMIPWIILDQCKHRQNTSPMDLM